MYLHWTTEAYKMYDTQLGSDSVDQCFPNAGPRTETGPRASVRRSARARQEKYKYMAFLKFYKTSGQIMNNSHPLSTPMHVYIDRTYALASRAVFLNLFKGKSPIKFFGRPKSPQVTYTQRLKWKLSVTSFR